MKRQRHLLHVFSTFDAGGPQVRAAAIINALGSQWRHSIVAMDGNYGAAGRLRISDVALVPRPAARSSLIAPFSFRDLICRVRPDLLATYNWGAMDAVAGAQLARVCPVIHGEDGFGADEARQRKARRIVVRRLLLPFAYKTVVPSKTLYQIASSEYHLPESKLLYLPNGVDTTRFRPGLPRDVRSQLSIAPDTVVFGSIGVLRAEKNLTLLVEAFHKASLASAVLVIVGDGPCRGELAQTIARLGVDASVRLVPAVADTAPYYAAFDVFVMSSKTEQLPLALLEAMACGLPVVATAVGDIPYVVGEDFPALVAPNDAGRLAESLRLLYGDRQLRASLGERNRQICGKDYALDQMLERYADLYETAAASPSMPCMQSITSRAT
jgi:glycosyltransferase involved in cell wall biosynthesis